MKFIAHSSKFMIHYFVKASIFLTKLLLLFFLTGSSAVLGARIEIKLSGLAPGPVYLARYKADILEYTDTTHTDIYGNGVFENNSGWQQGLYMLVLPSRVSIQFIMGSDQDFYIETSTIDVFNKLVIRGSSESEAYLDYLRRYLHFQKQKTALQEKTTDNDKIILDSLETDFAVFRNKLLNRYAGTMFALYVRASVAPEPIPVDAHAPDPVKWKQMLYNYRQSYWDHFLLSDRRTLYTDLYYNRLRKYFTQVVPSQPDSLIGYIDRFLQQGFDTMIYRYTLEYLYQEYLQQPDPTFEPVLHHIGKKYFVNKNPYWVSSGDVLLIARFIEKLETALKGYPLADFQIITEGGLQQNFYQFAPSEGAVIFVKSTCGSCKNLLRALADSLSRKPKPWPLVVVVDFEFDNSYEIANSGLLMVDGRKHRDYYYQHFRIYQVPYAILFDENRIVGDKTMNSQIILDFLTQ